MAEDGVGELARGRQRLEPLAELAAEQVVDRGEHLRPRAVVAAEREPAAGRLAPLAEDGHVRVPEAVDRLELVPDREDVRVLGQQVDQLALEAIRVLELVDHDRAEAQRLLRPDRVVVAQKVARDELQVLEVERRLARLRGRVRLGEAVEQRLEQVAVVRGELVERRLLDRLPRLLVRGGALAAGAVRRQVEQPLGQRIAPPRARASGAAFARASSVASASSARHRAATRSCSTRSASGGRSPSSSTSGRPAARSVS